MGAVAGRQGNVLLRLCGKHHFTGQDINELEIQIVAVPPGSFGDRRKGPDVLRTHLSTSCCRHAQIAVAEKTAQSGLMPLGSGKPVKPAGGAEHGQRQQNQQLILLVGCAFPFFFWMLRLAVSRNREFAADARAVELTRHPAGLRSALEKLLADTARGKALPRSMSPLAIASVGAARRWNTAGWPPVARTILVFFSTHPPLRERIARLEGMGAGEGAEREPAFAGTS